MRYPRAFDDLGFPIHEEGASTVLEGLYFVGVHFLRKRKSSPLIGVGEDAAIVAGKIATGYFAFEGPLYAKPTGNRAAQLREHD